MSSCLTSQSAYAYSGDAAIGQCVSDLGGKFIRQPGMYQGDLQDNIFGIIEAQLQPLISLHHLGNRKIITNTSNRKLNKREVPHNKETNTWTNCEFHASLLSVCCVRL